MGEKKKREMWLRLDNAAKIFPASMRRGWSNVFRISVSFHEKVDPAALERAVERVTERFPSVCVRLGSGLFWYYLEEGKTPPEIKQESCQPLLPMTKREMRRCTVRILWYENRIAVEFFHAVTDGGGGSLFVKTLAAQYLEEKYGQAIPATCGVLDVNKKPEKEELEDSFLRYAGSYPASRSTDGAYRLTGTPEPDGFLHVTCASIPVKEILDLARKKGVSITALLSACLAVSIAKIQRERVSPSRERAVRVQIPVNLRKVFPSKTLRNFVAVVNVGMEKGECDTPLDELIEKISHQMALFITPRNLKSIFTANVNSEKGMAIRLVPLFFKNIVMRAVFDRVGETSACLCLSNLGEMKVPEEMKKQVTRFDFIIGPQAKAPYNCGVVSYGGMLRIHLVRNTREPSLEREFFPLLSSLGLSVSLESNER